MSLLKLVLPVHLSKMQRIPFRPYSDPVGPEIDSGPNRGQAGRLSNSAKIADVLTGRFGLEALRDGQQQVIEALLDGRNALAVFPTGGGKSLCYQLPALLLDGVTLVVSPLIALMKDQVDALQARDIGAARFDSSLSLDEAAAVWRGLESGKTKLLYLAPERLANANFREKLRRFKIAMMAVDEAHCISAWGHNFRPDYLKLADFAAELKAGRLLALTATATPRVSEEICERFKVAAGDYVQLSFRRDNLQVKVTPCEEAERDAVLLEKINAGSGAAVVYVTLQFTAERVATFLSKNGVNAKAYHAGLRDDYRAEVQEMFMADEVDVVVATIAFGMGIDKADIRAVYHYNLPKSLENYVQEIGRAGRDGEPSRCELLACADDLTVLENFTFGDTPAVSSLRTLLDRLLRQGEEFDISRYELSANNDIRPLVVATVLTYLELRGIISATAPFYAQFRIEFLRSEEAVLPGYDADRQAFLRKVFAAGKRGYKYLTIDTAKVAMQIGEDPDRVRRAILHLEEAGDIIAKPAGLRQGYRMLEQIEDIRGLADDMAADFVQRESGDIARLQTVVDFAEAASCRTRAMLEYFGEAMPEDCGSCDVCLGEATAGELPRSASPEMQDEDLEMVHALIAKPHAALRSPRQVARFLCGLTSPATTRARLTRNDCFGLFDKHPFGDVLTYCESLNLG